MELIPVKASNNLLIDEQRQTRSTAKPFIQANTMESSLREIKEKHIIPVFSKDNEPVISHGDFIETAQDVVSSLYPGETILIPSIRVSHPIKGRIPEAKNKPASVLQDHERTVYFERMAFVIEIPSISAEIDNQTLSLTVGGVKAYNLDNLYNKKGTDEHFKVFIGFQNRVCTNLCVWTDGFMSNLRVKNIGQLKGSIRTLIENYNSNFHLHSLRKLTNYALTEQQFAMMIGRCRMYIHLPTEYKKDIQEVNLGDNQVATICKDYYRDNSFCRADDGAINLWKLFNLFTGANKSTYIDNFLDRSVNAFSFVDSLRAALDNKTSSWYLS